MDPLKEREIEERLARLEASLAAIERSLARGGRWAEAGGEARQSAPRYSNAGARQHSSAPDDLTSIVSRWFTSQSPEWWLSRIGIGFVVIAVLFLYGYAIDRGWITPPIRVLAGAMVGAGLFWAAIRVGTNAMTASGHGLRQVLYGGAVAVWYLTADAASVWYGLISIPSARLLFFVLTLTSAWISLQERSEIFAFIAIATGFATPFILFAPVTSLTPFALYLGAVAFAGIFIYLVRGWQSTLWMTFVAFWLLVNGTALSGGVIRAGAPGAIPVSFLLILAGAAFTRVPSLRRQLLETGSSRYTPTPVSEASQRLMEGLDSLSRMLGGGRSSPDSLALWVMTLLSPVLAISSLANIWVTIPSEVSGLLLVGLGSAALSFGLRKIQDTELEQVIFTAAALWSLLGILKIAPTPESVGIVSVYAALIVTYLRKALVGPRTIAKAAILISLVAAVGHGLSLPASGALRWRWVVAELVTVGASAVISRKLVADAAERMQGAVLAGMTYLAALVVIMNLLEPVWPPLVTAAYAVFGAALLIVSRQRGGARVLLQLGGVTMVIVVARLLLVDMASVETIWRVLLFLVCGGVFLYAGHRLQPARAAEAGE
ncbi:MAG: DUF2339 domain-containing protein [Gemmatimonadaceae bacterium]